MKVYSPICVSRALGSWKDLLTEDCLHTGMIITSEPLAQEQIRMPAPEPKFLCGNHNFPLVACRVCLSDRILA